jgi:pilus assembly protein CpaB
MSWLSRNRRLAIALLLCIAAGIAVHQLTPAPADTATTLAAARDLPAGTALAAADLAPVKIPPQLVNAGSITDPSEATGKQLAAPLRKGQLLTDSQLLGPGLLAGAPPGSAAVPLRMADPSSIQLVSPGQLVNVVLTGANGYAQNSPSQVLASSVPVLWTSGQGGKTGQWLGTGETDGLIVVAAAPDQAARLAGASTQGKLFFVLVGPPGAAG